MSCMLYHNFTTDYIIYYFACLLHIISNYLFMIFIYMYFPLIKPAIFYVILLLKCLIANDVATLVDQNVLKLVMDLSFYSNLKQKLNSVNTVDVFVFWGTNFYGLGKNYTFVGLKIRGHSIFLHNLYRKFIGTRFRRFDHPRKPRKLVPHEN